MQTNLEYFERADGNHEGNNHNGVDEHVDQVVNKITILEWR